MSNPEIDFLREDDGQAAPEVAEAPQETVVSPEEPAPVAPTAQEPHEERVPLAALKAEREKRQNEQRLREQMERELAQLRQQPQEPPDFYANPQEYVHTLLQYQQRGFQQQMLSALEDQARETFPDYDEVFEEVKEAVAANPAYRAQIFSAANPATAAYKLGKQLRQMREMQDPNAYRAKVEAEIRQKIEAEYRAKEEAAKRAAAAIPPDIAASRSSAGNDPVEDDSLEAILQSRKR